MYCVNCGLQLPDDANFCSKCGKPQNPEMGAKEQIWETCEIVWEEWEEPYTMRIAPPDDSRCSGRFCALALGPNGAYIAATTSQGRFDAYSMSQYEYERYPSDKSADEGFFGDKSAEEFLGAFIKDLVANGWEPIETQGDKWYGYKFRRRMK